MRYRFLPSIAVVFGLLISVTAQSVQAASKPAVQGPPAPAVRKPAPKVNLVPAGWPKLFAMPRFKVVASIEPLGFNSFADTHAPYKWNDVAWYSRGPRPGDLGRATIFGHLDSTCCPAVFWELHALHTGDRILVGYKNGKTLQFQVMWQATYLNAKMPVKFMFGSTRDRGLTLVTCAGIFHRDGTGYDHKLVVYTRLILPNGKLG